VRRLLIVALAALAGLGAAAAWLARDERTPPAASIDVAGALGGDAAGYARALAPRPFAFPADHGPHPEFRTEWWYYTGNLFTAGGRHVGYQLTFFRIALTPAPVAPASSAWRARDVYMAHFAVTDTAGGRFHPQTRFARGALGLAGAQAAPFHVWIEDWSAEAADDGAAATPPMRLRAASDAVAIDLVLESPRPAVLQGDRGLSRKGPEPGNASYYYSLTRMPTRGRVRIGGAELAVGGLSWMDREWSTSALGEAVGWDWFALHLADGRDLMFYRLRRADGSADELSAGSVVEAGGTVRPLARDDVRIDVLDWWASPRGGARYPGRWRLRAPAHHLDVEITPVLADQEHREPVRYWEGAVRVRAWPAGPAAAAAAPAADPAGQGYVELVGYADRVPGR
jgi:predicted secreted hydrolase